MQEQSYPCPFCAEKIERSAAYCQFCGEAVANKTPTGFSPQSQSPAVVSRSRSSSFKETSIAAIKKMGLLFFVSIVGGIILNSFSHSKSVDSSLPATIGMALVPFLPATIVGACIKGMGGVVAGCIIIAVIYGLVALGRSG